MVSPAFQMIYDLAAIIERYPDRFMIGTDKVGHWTDYPHEIGKYYMLIDKLKPETAKKLCRESALVVLGKSQEEK